MTGPDSLVVEASASGVVGQRFENSEYDQEIPQSLTVDNPVAPRGRAAQPSRVDGSVVCSEMAS